MQSLENIKKILDDGTWVVPSALRKGIDDYYGLSLHIDGILPSFVNATGGRVIPDNRICPEYQFIFDQFLFSRHPREKAEQRWWRYSQYRPFQKDPFLRVINVINAAIFQDTGYSLMVENKDDEQYLWATELDGRQNFLNQFISHTKNIFTDACGYLCVLPDKSWEEKGQNKLKPYIAFIHSKDIKFLSHDEIVFKHGKYVWLINKVGYYRFVCDDGHKHTLVDKNGYYAHLLGVLPIVRAGGFYSSETYESWLSGAKPFADEYVSSKSSCQLVDKEASHPFITAAAADCNDCDGVGHFTHCATCNSAIDKCSCEIADGGFIKPKLVSCSNCGGSGKQSRNPGDWLIIPKEDMGDELIKIINPDVNINKHLKETAESVFDGIMLALNLSYVEGQQSGIAKTKDMETRYQFIIAISNDWFDRVIPMLINFSLALRNAKVVDGRLTPFVPNYTIIKPTQFNIKTASDLLIEYQISVQSGMPQYIRNRQLEDYVDKHFGGDHVMAKTVRVINELDIFASDTPSDIAAMSGTEDWQYHKQLPSAIRKAVRTKGETWFVAADIDDIKQEIAKFVVIKKQQTNGAEKEEGRKGGESAIEGEPQALYGQGNSATRSGNSPTGTGNYNQQG